MKKIIAISGRAESGKSLVAEYLKTLLLNNLQQWEIRAFSACLKWISSIVTNTMYDTFESNKNKKLPPPWDNFTARTFLQEVGTKLREVDPDFWIKTLNTQGNIIIHDLRFKNELEWVKSQGGITIRIERFTKGYSYTNGLELKNNAHISETELDSEEFDFTIINNGTKEELHIKVTELTNSDEFRNRVYPDK